MVKFKNLLFFMILEASKLIRHMILLLMGDMLIHVGGLEPNIKKTTGFRIFQPSRSRTSLIYANHAKLSAPTIFDDI